VVFPRLRAPFFPISKYKKQKTKQDYSLCPCAILLHPIGIHWVSGLYDGIILRIAVPALFLSLSHSKTIKRYYK
jgi:hypothetical protein